VSNIFRKAQNEMEFIIFYGKLCEEMMKLELKLRGHGVTKSRMKNSLFRKNLINSCKECFERFFNKEDKEKTLNDPEKSILYKMHLFGNLEFVGELYRRKIVSESLMGKIFEPLLEGESEDFYVEGAICLMNKVGLDFE